MSCKYEHEFVPLDSTRLFCKRCGDGIIWTEPKIKKLVVKKTSSNKNKKSKSNYDEERESFKRDIGYEPTADELEAEALRIYQETMNPQNTYEYAGPSNVPVDGPFDDSIGNGDVF